MNERKNYQEYERKTGQKRTPVCSCERFSKATFLNVWKCEVHGTVDRPLFENVIRIENHPLFSESDFEYFRSKGYTAQEIIEVWDRDLSNGVTEPTEHPEVFDIVGYLSEGME